MSFSITGSLNNIEFLIQEVLEELESVREQVCNMYESADPKTIRQAEIETEHHEAFEFLVNNGN